MVWTGTEMLTGWLTPPKRFHEPDVPESKREPGFHHDRPVVGLLMSKGCVSGQVVEEPRLVMYTLITATNWPICETDMSQP